MFCNAYHNFWIKTRQKCWVTDMHYLLLQVLNSQYHPIRIYFYGSKCPNKHYLHIWSLDTDTRQCRTLLWHSYKMCRITQTSVLNKIVFHFTSTPFGPVSDTYITFVQIVSYNWDKYLKHKFFSLFLAHTVDKSLK